MGAQAGNILGYWARGRKPIVQSLLLWLSPALVLALLEPFDSGVLPLPLRFAYWALLMVSFSLVLPPCIGLAERLYGAHTRHGPTILAIACAIAAVPVTLVVQVLDWLLALAAVPVFGQPVPPESPRFAEPLVFLATYVSVYLVAVLIVAGVSLLRLARHRSVSSTPGLRPGVQFLSRLPLSIGTELVCIRMEDHYLRVTTQRGEALILLRLRDALKELEDYPGFQVHRSWWVASDQVKQLSRNGRRLNIVLLNGRQIPVSASFREQVERLVLG